MKDFYKDNEPDGGLADSQKQYRDIMRENSADRNAKRTLIISYIGVGIALAALVVSIIALFLR